MEEADKTELPRDDQGRWSRHALPEWQLILRKSRILQRFFQTCGRAGGETGARNMTKEERRVRAQRAGTARWMKRNVIG